MLENFLNKILGIGCPVCDNKLGGLSMTVQELIDELNKRIKDKSKDIWAYDESGIYSVEEYDDMVIIS